MSDDLAGAVRAEARSWIMTKPNRAHRLNRAAERIEQLEAASATRLDYERRILALELELGNAMRVAEEARALAAIMRRNCENIDAAICVASKNRYHQDDGGGFKIEGFMSSVIAVEKALAELTGIDGDDDWYWRQRAASVDRSPEGEKPQALNAQHESAVPEGQTPNTHSEAPDNG